MTYLLALDQGTSNTGEPAQGAPVEIKSPGAAFVAGATKNAFLK